MTDITVDEIMQKRKALGKQLQVLQQQAAVAQADEERIRKELATHLARLKEEFGCNTIDQAAKLLNNLLEEAAQKCTDLENQLNDLRRA